MNLENSVIAQVEIYGLHGDRNIISNFKSPIKILVDENGSGKTTFLNILIGLLQNKLHIVNRYEFDEVRIQFTSGENITFAKRELQKHFQNVDDPLITEILTSFPKELVDDLVLSTFNLPYSELRSHGVLNLVAENLGVPPKLIYERIQRESSLRKRRGVIAHQRSLFDEVDEERSNQLKLKLSELRKLFPYRVLYFPTYRLVEENLHYLGYEKKIHKRGEQLIQFGMRDVKQRWDDITEDIRKSTLQGFSKINGRMLDVLTGGIRPESINYGNIEQPKALEIVLARSGENISPSSRTRILELVRSEDIKQNEFTPLAYFLSNLIEIYKQQQTIDDAIKNFVNVANNYLTDKEIDYDETEMTKVGPIVKTTKQEK